MFIIKRVERLNGRPKYIRSNKDVIVLSKPSSWASSLEKLETKKKKKVIWYLEIVNLLGVLEMEYNK